MNHVTKEHVQHNSFVLQFFHFLEYNLLLLLILNLRYSGDFYTTGVVLSVVESIEIALLHQMLESQ